MTTDTQSLIIDEKETIDIFNATNTLVASLKFFITSKGLWVCFNQHTSGYRYVKVADAMMPSSVGYYTEQAFAFIEKVKANVANKKHPLFDIASKE